MASKPIESFNGMPIVHSGRTRYLPIKEASPQIAIVAKDLSGQIHLFRDDQSEEIPKGWTICGSMKVLAIDTSVVEMPSIEPPIKPNQEPSYYPWLLRPCEERDCRQGQILFSPEGEFPVVGFDVGFLSLTENGARMVGTSFMSADSPCSQIEMSVKDAVEKGWRTYRDSYRGNCQDCKNLYPCGCAAGMARLAIAREKLSPRGIAPCPL